MSKENNMVEGVIYRSAVSGLYYQNIDAAGDVDAVRVNGEVFSKITNEELKNNAEQALLHLKRIKEEECSNEAWNLLDTAAEFLEI